MKNEIEISFLWKSVKIKNPIIKVLPTTTRVKKTSNALNNYFVRISECTNKLSLF